MVFYLKPLNRLLILLRICKDIKKEIIEVEPLRTLKKYLRLWLSQTTSQSEPMMSNPLETLWLAGLVMYEVIFETLHGQIQRKVLSFKSPLFLTRGRGKHDLANTIHIYQVTCLLGSRQP